MTAQSAERIFYQGENQAMFTNPLFDYFALGRIEPPFVAPNTALWRGYVGTWEITGDRLYLIGLKGYLEGYTEATLAAIFPDFPDRVFAHWYSGPLRIPQGEMLNYFHGGYGSTYERDVLLDVERGVIVNTQIRLNEFPAVGKVES